MSSRGEKLRQDLPAPANFSSSRGAAIFSSVEDRPCSLPAVSHRITAIYPLGESDSVLRSKVCPRQLADSQKVLFENGDIRPIQ